jgi:hypothetical protein
MTTTISEALATQATLLDKLAGIILNLIAIPNANKIDKLAAEARISELMAVDRANAEAIVSGNSKLQELLDVAAAAILPDSYRAIANAAAAIYPTPPVGGNLGNDTDVM